jgi:hypothetical protein
MKKILILLILIGLNITLEASTYHKDTAESELIDLTKECIISVDRSDEFTHVTYLNKDNEVVHQVIAAVAIVYLPEALRAICRMVANEQEQKICDVIYSVTSVLVTLTGKRAYKGAMHGFAWSAAKGKTRGIAKIETSTYSHVALLKKILKAYHKGCVIGKGIPWESISESEYNSDVKNYGVGNKSCYGVKKTLDNLYSCSLQNLMMEGWKNDRIHNFTANSSKKMVKVNFDNILMLEEPGFNKDVLDFLSLTYKGEYFEFIEQKKYSTPYLERLTSHVRADGTWYKIRVAEGVERWILGKSSIYSKYGDSASLVN